jgi:hypothetical protein
MHPSCLSFKLMINPFSTRRDVYWISLEHPTIKESCSSSFWLFCYIDISRTKGLWLCFWYVGKVLMRGGVMKSFIIFKLSMQELLNIPITIKNIVDIQCVNQISMHKVEIPWILMPQSKNYHKFPIWARSFVVENLLEFL